MPLAKVTLVLNLQDGTGTLASSGMAILRPSAIVKDASDHAVVGTAPVRVRFDQAAGVAPQVILIANVQSGLSPSGWTWDIDFSGIDGAPDPFSFRLDPDNGSTQYLADQVAVDDPDTREGFMPLPTGTPAAGDVPVVMADGSPVTSWDQPSGGTSAVSSVNGQDGDVELTAADVGADASGAAATAQTAAQDHADTAAAAAQTAAEAHADSAIAALTAADVGADPAGTAASVITALGLGTAATHAVGDFDAAGAASVAQSAAEAHADSAIAALTASDVGADPAGSAAAVTLTSLGAASSVDLTAETSRAETAEAALLPANQLGPQDHGLIAWTFPPYNCRSSDSQSTTAGTVYLSKIPVPEAIEISSVGFSIVTAPTELTAGECFAGLYSADGDLLAQTADLSGSAHFGTTGNKLEPLAGAPVSVDAGYVYVAWLWNGTGNLGLLVGNSQIVANFNLAAASALFATADTGRTSLPSSLGTLAALNNGARWACVA